MDTVPITNRCPKCAAPLPADAPEGLCTKCLLAAVSTPTEGGAPAEGRPAPPTLEAVAAAFPQLEILELIGAGGMGVVYKARQPKLERQVALKLLQHRPGADPSFAERFNREARVLARLNHPNIVTVYDFGQAGDFFFLTMEYVDGVNLRQAMQTGRFTPPQALALVPKVCEALQYAHDEGILHRDIKPENILLDTRGRVKIADFGIAKLVGDRAPEAKLTASGAALGTPHYMAPEQLESPETVDQRADIYSLGVVFYEMLTGELPIGRFAPPSEKSTVDPRVDEVVFQALEKEREKRIGTAREVKTRVETISGGPPAAAAGGAQDEPVRLKPSLKPIVLLGLIVALVGLVINTVPAAILMIRSLVGFATSSVAGALCAALAVAGFGGLMWLTWHCRNLILGPVGLGPVTMAAARASGSRAGLDRRLHKVAAFTLMALAVFLGARVVLFMVSMLHWLFGTGWIGYAALALVALVVFVTRSKWLPWLSGFSRQALASAEDASSLSSVAGPGAVPPLLASRRPNPAWPVVVVLLVVLIALPALFFTYFFTHTGRARPVRTTPARVSHARPAATESVLRARRVPEASRLPGLTVFQWKCSVPANHVLVFRLVQWSSNGVPTELDNLSGYAVASADKPTEATFQWSVQDGARLSPDLQGKYRWDRSVSVGSSRVDGAPVWMPKEESDWSSILQGEGQKTRLRPGETVPMEMFVRSGREVDPRAVEAQVTFEPLPEGVAADKNPHVRLGTNWLEGAAQKTEPVVEEPASTREHR
jgi:tRNA A-37 threonylcarbamoyl transferase component Bud32